TSSPPRAKCLIYLNFAPRACRPAGRAGRTGATRPTARQLANYLFASCLQRYQALSTIDACGRPRGTRCSAAALWLLCCPQAQHLPAFSHARASQPSQLSLISLAFLPREEIWAAEGEAVLIEWREVRDGNGSGGPNEDTARISGPVSRSATAFKFCIQGQIRLRRHLVIGSQGRRSLNICKCV